MHTTPMRRLGALLGLALTLALLNPAVAAPAAGSGGTPAASISVVGAATEGHTYRAFQIARYAHVDLDDGLPVGVTLETTPAALKAALGREIARIERARTGTAPAVAADGRLQGLDPLDWVARNWPQGSTTGDLWGNLSSTTGPLRDLADWLGTAVEDPLLAGLTEVVATGTRPTSGTASATFADLPAGLYALADPQPQSRQRRSAATTPATHSPTIIVGTQIPVDGILRDLYDTAGGIRRVLGVVNVKGDAVTITKTIGDPGKAGFPTFAAGDAVPVLIETRLPQYALFPASSPIQFEITDTHSVGLGLPDWEARDARLADPVLTVGSTTLRYDAACVVGLANTDDPCFAVTSHRSDGNSTSWTVRLPDWVARTHGGDVVVVTFEQLLSPDSRSAHSVSGVVGTRDVNSASVTFSDNSDHPETTTTAATPDVAVYTFPLYLTKVDATTGTRLADVDFTITSPRGTHCFAPDDAGVFWHRGVAPDADRCPAGTAARVTTATDGTFSLQGLEGGVEYTVAEVKQPAGYDSANLRIVRFTVTARPTDAVGSNPVSFVRVDYEYGSAGTVRTLGAFFHAAKTTATVPTSAGNERRDVTTASVTVKNWVKGPDIETGGVIRRLGINTGTAAIAIGLLGVSAVFFAMAARQRRRGTAPTSTASVAP